MLNLNERYFVAQDMLDHWRQHESRRSYPRVIARELMRYNYITFQLFSKYLTEVNRIPVTFGTLKSEVDEIKQASIQTFEEFMNVSKSLKIGGFCFADCDAEATAAQSDDVLLEEIEYSFLTYYITFDGVLAFIELVTQGYSQPEALAILTDCSNEHLLGDDKYTSLILFILKNQVAPFVSLQLRKGVITNKYRFPEDIYSSSTSNFSDYINATPLLVDFIKKNPQYSDPQIVLDKFLEGESNSIIINRIERLKSEFDVLNKNRGDSKIIVDVYKQNDGSDLQLISQYFGDEVYNPNGILRSLLYDCPSLLDVHRAIYSCHEDLSQLPEELCDCEHPYVQSEIALHLLSDEIVTEKALVFLQWALNTAFSSPNHFWHNCEAICGCTEAILTFRQLLYLDNSDLFEEITGLSFFHCLYLYLSRSIVLCRQNLSYANVCSERVPLNAIRIAMYEVELADLIALNRRSLLIDFLSNEEVDMVIDAHRRNAKQILQEWGLHMLALSVKESSCTNGDYQLSNLMMNVFDNYIYTLYRQGAMYVSESIVADSIQFLTQQNQMKDGAERNLNTYIRKLGHVVSQELWKRTLSQHQRDVVAIATQKDDKEAYAQFFKDHNITHLYHFTDRRNLDSIRKTGLLSHFALKQNGITTYSGGDEYTQRKDKEFELDDYVRVSFHKRHPMGRRLKMEEKNRDFVILAISPEVAFCQDTLYSNKNAATDDHVHGGTLQHLYMVNMDAVNIEYSPVDNPMHEQRAAEIMVKHKIPLEYILNLDHPESF